MPSCQWFRKPKGKIRKTQNIKSLMLLTLFKRVVFYLKTKYLKILIRLKQI